jgi:predicted Zn-dependent protease
MNTKLLYAVLPAVFLCFCQPTPVTRRRQLTLVSNQELMQMSFKSYNEFLDEHEVVRGTESAGMVARVGKRIARATEEYLANNNMKDRVAGYKWEFNLIEDSAVNAFAMPGGKVGIFSGILPVARGETGLAVVMAHEIAHAVAWHGNERMSQALLVQLGGLALSTAISERPELTQRWMLAAFGLGAQVGILLPYSRLHETEADQLGLIFMAKAGYNPAEAVDFWQRMEKAHRGARPPEFLSTHPSSQSRIESIRKFLPRAMKYYRTDPDG